ncbi:MAG: virulence RhuM family protein [Acidobacteria bacterium]|nr:virulence RhuM family protein [Acidobacteriota bacterium]
MPSNQPPPSSIILYQTEDGRTRIQCRFDAETLWLTQVQIAELFQTSVPNINLHLKAIYTESELTEAATVKSYLIVRTEGARQVSREVHNSALRFRPGAHRHTRGRGRSAVACAGYHRAGGPGLLTAATRGGVRHTSRAGARARRRFPGAAAH